MRSALPWLWIGVLLLMGSRPALADYPLKMWQGERKVAEGKWPEAAQLYEQALQERPKSAEATYNLALCHYRQGHFDKAEPLFKKAVELASPGPLKGKAAYNQGNSLFRQKKLKEALEAYKLALRWNEPDSDTRYNIQVVLDMLKDQEKKPDPQKNKDKNNKNKDKDKDKDKNKDKDKDKKNKDKNKDKDRGKNKPDQGTPTPTPQPSSSPSPKPQTEQPPSPQQRDKEEAERLLQFFDNREKQVRKRQGKGRRAIPTGEDDW